MKKKYSNAVFVFYVLFATFILPLALLAMGKEPDDTRKENIEKTQSPDHNGHQRDSGNLFEGYGAWKERRKEIKAEDENKRLLPTEDSLGQS